MGTPGSTTPGRRATVAGPACSPRPPTTAGSAARPRRPTASRSSGSAGSSGPCSTGAGWATGRLGCWSSGRTRGRTRRSPTGRSSASRDAGSSTCCTTSASPGRTCSSTRSCTRSPVSSAGTSRTWRSTPTRRSPGTAPGCSTTRPSATTCGSSIAVGRAARETVLAWNRARGGTGDAAGGKLHLLDATAIGPSVRCVDVMHPGAGAQGASTEVAASFTAAARRVLGWARDTPAWLPADPGAGRGSASGFRYERAPIPLRDLPFGVPWRLGAGGTGTTRRDEGRSIELEPGVRQAGEPAYPAEASGGSRDGYDDEPGDLPWEPPRGSSSSTGVPTAAMARLLVGRAPGLAWPDFAALGIPGAATFGGGPRVPGPVQRRARAGARRPGGPRRPGVGPGAHRRGGPAPAGPVGRRRHHPQLPRPAHAARRHRGPVGREGVGARRPSRRGGHPPGGRRPGPRRQPRRRRRHRRPARRAHRRPPRPRRPAGRVVAVLVRRRRPGRVGGGPRPAAGPRPDRRPAAHGAGAGTASGRRSRGSTCRSACRGGRARPATGSCDPSGWRAPTRRPTRRTRCGRPGGWRSIRPRGRADGRSPSHAGLA